MSLKMFRPRPATARPVPQQLLEVCSREILLVQELVLNHLQLLPLMILLLTQVGLLATIPLQRAPENAAALITYLALLERIMIAWTLVGCMHLLVHVALAIPSRYKALHLLWIPVTLHLLWIIMALQLLWIPVTLRLLRIPVTLHLLWIPVALLFLWIPMTLHLLWVRVTLQLLRIPLTQWLLWIPVTLRLLWIPVALQLLWIPVTLHLLQIPVTLQ